MKIFRSIRWRLQLWHGVLLAMVLVGFGFTSFQFQRGNQFHQIDQELEQRVSPVSEVLRRAGFDPDRPPKKSVPAPQNLHLPESESRLFDEPQGRAFYFVVWLPDGREIARSRSAPAEVPYPGHRDQPRELRQRGPFLEHFHSGEGCGILIGQNISEQLTGIHRYAWVLFGSGGIVFLLGFAGGWWISTQTLRPISDISLTAAKIADGDLAQRIPTDGPGSELGDLIGVLNKTFSRLQSSFARQSQFTADASHELRTPLSVVLMQTQTALARERPAAEYRESLEACQRAATRMRRLTESLLTLARLDSGDTVVPKKSCRLDSITSETVELLRPLANARSITLNLELEPVTCFGNVEQFGQIITNLVGNAISYNRPGGLIQVKLTKEANEAVLSVSDTGQGIQSENLQQVFERFYRADKARNGSSGHVGLGLSITKAIVEAHGGSIQVSSEINKGSTFTVRLGVEPRYLGES